MFTASLIACKCSRLYETKPYVKNLKILMKILFIFRESFALFVGKISFENFVKFFVGDFFQKNSMRLVARHRQTLLFNPSAQKTKAMV